MELVYGILKSAMLPIIGELEKKPPILAGHRPKLLFPANVQQIPQQYINPISGKPDPNKTTITIMIVSLPVSWIWLDAIEQLSEPELTEAACQSYLKNREIQAQQLKLQRSMDPAKRDN